MGIVAVAALAEIVDQMLPPVSKTATGRLTSSTAIAGNCSSRPAAQRYSIATVDKAFILETQADRFCEMRIAIGGLSAQHPHNGDRRLLAAGGTCQRRRASETQHKFAPPHVRPLAESIVPAQARLMKVARVKTRKPGRRAEAGISTP